MKNILMIIMLVCMSVLIATEIDTDAGTTGFKMLTMPSSTTSAGMAGTGSLFAEDAFGFLTNPANGLTIDNNFLSINSYQWIMDTNLTQLAFMKGNRKSSFGVSFRYLDYGKIENRDDQGNLIGHYQPMDGQIAFNFARRITPNHLIGINSSVIYEAIHLSSSVGVSFDFGYIYRTPIQGLSLAYSAQNIGKTSEMDEEAIDLPLTNNLSMHYQTKLGNIEFNNEIKISQMIENDQPNVSLGSAIKMHKNLSTRLGYKLNSDSENFSGGVSFHLKRISLDYTYLPFGEELGDLHILGISYKL